MIDVDSAVRQAVGDLRDIFSAHLHQKRVRLHHIDLFDRIILDQLTDHASVSAAHDKDLLHIRVHRHRHMSDHLVIDELIPLSEHQISVHDQDLAEISGLQHIDTLDFALRAEQLLFNTDGQLHTVRMDIRKPHFHLSHLTSPSVHSDARSARPQDLSSSIPFLLHTQYN